MTDAEIGTLLDAVMASSGAFQTALEVLVANEKHPPSSAALRFLAAMQAQNAKALYQLANLPRHAPKLYPLPSKRRGPPVKITGGWPPAL